MANTTSAKKMIRKIAKRTAINRSRRSRMRTFRPQGRGGDRFGRRHRRGGGLPAAEPEIMRAAQKGVMHQNTASRKVSRLAHRVDALGA